VEPVSRILVTDDHEVFRKRVVEIITNTWPQIVVDETTEGQHAVALAERQRYSVVLLDLSMPGMGGLEVLREMKSLRPEVPVLILSMHSAEQYAESAFRAGADGYLTKDRAAGELTRAIQVAMAGRPYSSNFIE
jgi:two-component system invasion response regulator UvrY